MITSRTGKGLIYAGDTPLACTIRVEQTGPMEVTVRGGVFTTTGQACVRAARPSDDALIAEGRAEDLGDGRVRVWRMENGAPMKARTYTLVGDHVIPIKSERGHAVAYDLDLIARGQTTDVLVRHARLGIEEFGETPDGWVKVHELLFPFVVPARCEDLAPLSIFALKVEPGFPAGTGPKDWMQQSGITDLGGS